MLILIGGIFLLTEFYPDLIERQYIWPLVLMAFGVFLIFKPRHRHWGVQEQEGTTPFVPEEGPKQEIQVKEPIGSDEDYLDSIWWYQKNTIHQELPRW